MHLHLLTSTAAEYTAAGFCAGWLARSIAGYVTRARREPIRRNKP